MIIMTIADPFPLLRRGNCGVHVGGGGIERPSYGVATGTKAIRQQPKTVACAGCADVNAIHILVLIGLRQHKAGKLYA